MSAPRRLLHLDLASPGERVSLGVDASKHASVLRLEVGDLVVLFDGRGGEADAEILERGEHWLLEIRTRRDEKPNDAPRVVLIQALPKGAKLDDIVRSATEAGVAEVHLAHSRHAVARPDAQRAESKLTRLSKIAAEAARQSERPDVPKIFPPADLSKVAERAPASAARMILSARQGDAWDRALAPETWIVVGPEGGLSGEEEATLMAIGWQRARIAVPILRVETAAPVAVAMIVDRLMRASGGGLYSGAPHASH